MTDEVALAKQQVAPHGLQVLQEQVVAVKDVQQVLAGVEVGHVDLPLERPLQVRQQLCGCEKERGKGIAIRARKIFLYIGLSPGFLQNNSLFPFFTTSFSAQMFLFRVFLYASHTDVCKITFK